MANTQHSCLCGIYSQKRAIGSKCFFKNLSITFKNCEKRSKILKNCKKKTHSKPVNNGQQQSNTIKKGQKQFSIYE